LIAQEAPAPFKVAKIRPQLVRKGKVTDKLLRTKMLGVTIQVIAPDDGETNLHSHPGVDSAWIVVDGEAKFYTTEDQDVATLAKNEMLLIPGDTPYWFECSSSIPLVILHVSARLPDENRPRKDYTPAHEGESRREIIPGAFWEG
jgi:mannose-6-phosphate isomerase-like protein (cupin superfamily)